MSTHLAAVFTQAAAGSRSNAVTGPAAEAGGVTVNLQDLLRMHGEASTAVVLLVLSMTTVLPVAGLGSVLSFAIFALAWRWARQQETTTLPQKLGSLTLNPRWTRRCLRGLAWIYTQANRWLKPRWLTLTHDGARPLWSLWIALMGFVIFLPIPFGNVLPSLSLAALCLGWMFRDGLALVLSTLFGIAALAVTATFSQLLWQMLRKAIAWLPTLA
jgi:hypothetical protein